MGRMLSMIWSGALLKRRAGKWAGAVDFSLSRLVVFLCLSLALPADAEMMQGYPNLPGAAPGNAFASAPMLDSAVVVPLIGETRLEVPPPPASALASKAPNQIGVAVDIPAGQRTLPGLALDSAWTKVGQRQYARLTIRSPGAVSVRAGVAISGGFPGRVLSVSGAGEVESELKRTDGLSWSSTSDGDTLTLLVEIPAGYRYREGDISIPVVSHIDTDPLSAAGNGFANIYPTTSKCALDLACFPITNYRTAGASVMQILFTKNGNSYACSGTMLADSTRSYKPYVYTANHCIGSQAVADTVVTLWNLEYPACAVNNSGTPLGAVKLSNGAQLLHSSSDNDHAFLLLNDAPPAGSSFSGWNSDALTSGASIATIGHPMGDVKKIAFGSVRYPASAPVTVSGIYHASTWIVGITQGALQTGASGGGLFTCGTQSCYLRGGVFAGSDAQVCTSSQTVAFSRFDVAYQTIKQWLGVPVPTSLAFGGWPTNIDSNTSFPVGKITARFSDGSSRPVVALLTSSNANFLWQKDGAIFSGAATVDTPVVLTATFTENGATVTSSATINVLASDVVIKAKPAISAGGYFSLGLRSDGMVWGWGNNLYYALGKNAAYFSSNTPVKISGIADVTALSTRNHVLALKTDGTVWAWGYNPYGEVGNGTTASVDTPTQVSGISGVSAVTAGGGYSAALKLDGTVWSWGLNKFGQFGDGTSGTQASLVPAQAKGVANAKAIAAGGNHTIALLKDGTVMGWGYNKFGQLGAASNDQCAYLGSQWLCSKTPAKVPNLDNVVSIASGANHVLALRSDGTVWALGLNNGGQLGDGTAADSSTPKQVPVLTGVVAIAAGDNYSLALKSDGTVWAWGWNDKGQLGYSTTEVCTMPLWGNVPCSKSPAPVSALSDVSAISGGTSHSLALKTDGSVWAWGQNNYGQLGNNTSTSSAAPVRVVRLGGFLGLGANQAPKPIVASQSATAAVAASTPLDCLFTWAEGAHPELFSPSGVNTETREIYSYRFYSTTRAYLGLSSGDDHFYYLGPSSANRLTDLGAVSEWYTTAGCR